MISKEFQKQLKLLNPQQKEAVETIEGPVMVMAGPGTGKTQILTLRLANILARTDTNPENILALTFTESAAANMRRRLTGIIGAPAYYVNILTFHSFCNEIIKNYPDKFPAIIGSTPATPADQIAIIRKIIGSTPLKFLKPIGNKFYYVGPGLKAIKDLKNESLNPIHFIAKVKNPKEKELGLVYKKYQQELRTQKLYDFDDMILETVKTLQTKPDFLTELQEKYQYILVDEHQDTNGAQNKVLEMLCSYDIQPNLFIVGDEKQAIFRFQGACLENFLYFKNKYPKVKLVVLEQNYRSHQNILDAAHNVITNNLATFASTTLKSNQSTTGKKVNIISFENPEAEYLFLCQKIKSFALEKIKNKPIPAHEIAILYRENKEAEALADILARNKIPFTIESDENILEDIEIKKLNMLFKAINNPANIETAFKAAHLDFLEIDPLEIYKTPTNIPNDFYKKIINWKKLSYNQNFAQFFEKVIKDSGFIKHLLKQPDYHQQINKINTLFGEVKKISREKSNFDLRDYLEYIETLQEHNLPIKVKARIQENAVRLMTAHKAKGLEFNVVFITNVCDKHWGNRRNINHFDLPVTLIYTDKIERNEDERRLFYMALTRARKDIYITYATRSADGREQVPSQFISEIKPEFVTIPSIRSSTPRETMRWLKQSPAQPTVDENKLVKNIFAKKGLSPTSLNNYLRCPWSFFYNNLLQIPKTPTNSQMYGTAKHTALQKFFEAQNRNKRLLIKEFKNGLEKQFVSKNDLGQLNKKGQKTLSAYHDFYKNSWNFNTVTEFKISGVDWVISKNQKIKLTGKLDRIEFPNGSKRDKGEVTVVDYKTSQAKSRNWILGKTKDSRGDYFRQLVFYKLLLDLMPRPKYRMAAGVIDFIEPDDKGRFKKESFKISAADLSDLKNLIAHTANEILNLKFWDKRCDDKKCEYCQLREFLPKGKVI
ncbi:MAG: ATP-dependent DNA helicase [Patescibacteria group bacterium]